MKNKGFHKSIIKRITWSLSSNYYSLEEFNALSTRQALKTLKLIAKLEGIKFSKNQLKELLFVLNNYQDKKVVTKKISVLNSFFNFTFDVKERMVTTYHELIKFIAFVFNFRLEREKVYRN